MVVVVCRPVPSALGTEHRKRSHQAYTLHLEDGSLSLQNIPSELAVSHSSTLRKASYVIQPMWPFAVSIFFPSFAQSGSSGLRQCMRGPILFNHFVPSP